MRHAALFIARAARGTNGCSQFCGCLSSRFEQFFKLLQIYSNKLTADVYSMSLVHWELFVLCAALNVNHNSQHQLPYKVELNGQKPTITKLQEIVSKGLPVMRTHRLTTQKGTRPKVPDPFKQTIFGGQIYKILKESWDHDPNARITAATAAQRLHCMFS